MPVDADAVGQLEDVFAPKTEAAGASVGTQGGALGEVSAGEEALAAEGASGWTDTESGFVGGGSIEWQGGDWEWQGRGGSGSGAREDRVERDAKGEEVLIGGKLVGDSRVGNRGRLGGER